MSAPVVISSGEQFNNILSTTTYVVADFYADWCGPCKAIAPAYEQLSQQLSRPKRIAFVKINVDEQNDIAKAYGISAMPTFIVFQGGRPINTVRGADPRKLNEVVQKLAAEAGKEGPAGDEDDYGSGDSWVGASTPKNYSDITSNVDPKSMELLNMDSEFGIPRILFDPSKPASLSKAKAKDSGFSPDWVESDTDEQLMLYIPLQSNAKIHTLHITSLPSGDDEDGPMRPKTIKLYTNRSQVLGFDEADDIPSVQTITINPEDWDAQTGTVKIELRFVKFQNVTSMVMFFVDGDGDSDKLRVDRIRMFGEAGEKRDMGKLEKIGDEPGE